MQSRVSLFLFLDFYYNAIHVLHCLQILLLPTSLWVRGSQFMTSVGTLTCQLQVLLRLAYLWGF